MPDKFENHTTGLSSPASDGAQVIPNDIADLTTTARALYIGSQGDIKVELASGAVVLFVGAVGILPVRVTRVYETLTTATDIVALW